MIKKQMQILKKNKLNNNDLNDKNNLEENIEDELNNNNGINGSFDLNKDELNNNDLNNSFNLKNNKEDASCEKIGVNEQLNCEKTNCEQTNYEQINANEQFNYEQTNCEQTNYEQINANEQFNYEQTNCEPNDNSKYITEILLKKAKGFKLEEVSEEYVFDDENEKMILNKRKITTKEVAPDLNALKALIEMNKSSLCDDYKNMSDEELKAEKQKLIKLLSQEDEECF